MTHNVPGKAIYVPILWFDSLYLNNLHLSKHAYKVLLDLFCIFPENIHEKQLIPAKLLYQWPSRNILDCVYGGSQFSTGVIFQRVRHVKNGPLWHFFYTCDTFLYGQGVISLRRKMTPRSFFDGGRYSSLHWAAECPVPTNRNTDRKTRTTRIEHWHWHCFKELG